MADEELYRCITFFQNAEVLRFNVSGSPEKQPREFVGKRRNETSGPFRGIEIVKSDAVCLIDNRVNLILAGDGKKKVMFALLSNFTFNGPDTISPCLVSPDTGVEQGDNDGTLSTFKGGLLPEG